MQKLKDLWLGRLPLEAAFWEYAIVYGLLLNMVATGAALALIVLEAPVALAVIVHLLPVPYSILAACGVWRSADRYAGSRSFVSACRAGVIAWFGFWLVF